MVCKELHSSTGGSIRVIRRRIRQLQQRVFLKRFKDDHSNLMHIGMFADGYMHVCFFLDGDVREDSMGSPVVDELV